MRGVIESDLHSGDKYGLVNPANVSEPYKSLAKKLFEWRVAKMEEIGKIDFHICPGELTEGPGKKSTIELWEPDMEKQAEHTAELLAMWDCPVYYMTYSSAYHSADDLRSDNLVVEKLKLYHNREASIKTTQRLLINGVKINVFHVIGGGSTPEAFARALMKGVSVDVVRGSYRDYEPADLYIRGHSHVYGFAGNDKWTAYNAPCLKWPFGQYGGKIDRPYYAMGMLELNISDAGEWEIKPHIFRYGVPEEEYHAVSGRDGSGDKRRSTGKARRGRRQSAA